MVTRDGRLVWLLDAYTTTDHFPYAQPTRGVGNYIRNPVKITVDAYHGTVRFFLVDADEPLIRAYGRAFPGLFQPVAAMPQDLRDHIRYPQDLFGIQARMYVAYHMRDPQVFYNREDLWTIPIRKGEGGREVEMEPYYTIMRLPGESREEFILLLPSANVNDAVAFAERVREAVEARDFTYEGGSLRRTLSAGVAAGIVFASRSSTSTRPRDAGSLANTPAVTVEASGHGAAMTACASVSTIVSASRFRRSSAPASITPAASRRVAYVAIGSRARQNSYRSAFA